MPLADTDHHADRDTPAGYADLMPQQVLDALDAVGLRGDGRILQLNSYENRVFQVFLEDGRAVVAKFYRPGRWSNAQIVEEHQFALELAQAEVPVVPPLVLRAESDAVELHGDPATLACLPAAQGGHRFAVAARCAGREPELDDPVVLPQIGRFIGRLHAVGRRQPFEHRLAMHPADDARRARDLLRAGGFLTHEQRPGWEAACDTAIAGIAAAFEAAAPLRNLRLHGDCHIGNVLWRDGAPHMVDLDDACSGPAVQDLWMLVSGERTSMSQQLAHMLEGYTQFSDFDPRELALIEPLRTLRMLKHSAWLAARWSDPTFPLNFPFFGTAAYWSQQTTQLREQIEAMS
jgi:Ser/Thr protein kinase RdoA (MazF antagonist)